MYKFKKILPPAVGPPPQTPMEAPAPRPPAAPSTNSGRRLIVNRNLAPPEIKSWLRPCRRGWAQRSRGPEPAKPNWIQTNLATKRRDQTGGLIESCTSSKFPPPGYATDGEPHDSLREDTGRSTCEGWTGHTAGIRGSAATSALPARTTFQVRSYQELLGDRDKVILSPREGFPACASSFLRELLFLGLRLDCALFLPGIDYQTIGNGLAKKN